MAGFSVKLLEDFEGLGETMINVAKIINTRGLKGECKVYLYTDDPAHRFEKGRVLYLDEKEPVTVESFSMSKGLGYVKFKGINTVEQAEALRGKVLCIPKDQLPEKDEDEFYYHELMNCKVINQHGEDTGTVSDILETGANLVLRVSKDGSSYLFPFVNAFVKEINLDDKVIHIEEMEGLR